MIISDMITKVNFEKAYNRKIEYIVIHYTANVRDTAVGNTTYFRDVNRNASAHYFVDENCVYRCVKDENIAWHCGAKTYKHNTCRNNNSIGIEMCNSITRNETVEKNTILLVKELMNKYNIPIQNIIRHYDVTGKICPKPYVENNNLWNDFKKLLEEPKMENKIYNSIESVPLYGKEAVTWAMSKGILQGNSSGLNLNDDNLKTLIYLYRYDKIK